MEHELFLYNDNDGDIFYDVTLVVPIGKFRKGDEFSEVHIEDSLNGTYKILELFNNESELVG